MAPDARPRAQGCIDNSGAVPHASRQTVHLLHASVKNGARPRSRALVKKTAR